VAPYVPAAVGRAALAELDRSEVSGDKLVALQRLAESDDDALADATFALYAGLHDDEALTDDTAPVVPFLIAVAADADLAPGDRLQLIALVANLALAADIGVRDALRASTANLHTLAGHTPVYAPLVGALVGAADDDAPSPDQLDAISVALDDLLSAATAG